MFPDTLPLADNFLDLVATSEIGDMMDLRDMETHYLVNEGLQHFSNPFLKGMAEKNHYQLGDNLSPIGVAFYIVPLVNAIARVGTMEEKILLFESMLEWKAYDLIPSTKRGCKGQQETRLEQSLRTCTNVKNRQTKEQDRAVEQVKEIIDNNNLLEHKVLLVKVEDPSYNKNITGLIANRIMAEYQHPVCLVSPTIYNEKKAWAGSARCPDIVEIEDFRAFCEKSGYTYLSAGHQCAFGIALYDYNINEFISYSDTAFKNIKFSPSYKVDYIFHQNDDFAKIILDLEEYKTLWGQYMAEPYIAVENIAVTKDMLTLMSRDKNPTLKIQLSNGVACIKFKSSEEELENLSSESGCVTINLVARAEVNRYFNSVTPQLIIINYEIINRQEYYF